MNVAYIQLIKGKEDVFELLAPTRCPAWKDDPEDYVCAYDVQRLFECHGVLGDDVSALGRTMRRERYARQEGFACHLSKRRAYRIPQRQSRRVQSGRYKYGIQTQL